MRWDEILAMPQSTATWTTTVTANPATTTSNYYWSPVDTNAETIAAPYKIVTGSEWVKLCSQLMELFKDHFERADLDISEDEFWRIWNDG